MYIIKTMKIMSARDLSKYLKINEKKSYKLVQGGLIPSMKIGGKVTFAEELIDKWILEVTEWGPQILVAGIDDVFLQNAVDSYNNGLHEEMVFHAPMGSVNGLKALKDHRVTMACVALPDGKENEAIAINLDKYLDMDRYVLVPLFFRQQGLIVPKDNPRKIKSFEDIVLKGATFVNRSRGTGTRLVLDHLLKKKQIGVRSIKGYDREADSELQVGLWVLRGISDTGFGTAHMAQMLDLDHVPLLEEKVGMVISAERCYSPEIKTFLSCFERPMPLCNTMDRIGW